jgi:hypothetical protein
VGVFKKRKEKKERESGVLKSAGPHCAARINVPIDIAFSC